MRSIDLELERRITVIEQLFSCDRDSDAESLDEAERVERLGDVGVAIIGNAGMSEVLDRRLAVGPPGLAISIRSENQLILVGALVDS